MSSDVMANTCSARLWTNKVLSVPGRPKDLELIELEVQIECLLPVHARTSLYANEMCQAVQQQGHLERHCCHRLQ